MDDGSLNWLHSIACVPGMARCLCMVSLMAALTAKVVLTSDWTLRSSSAASSSGNVGLLAKTTACG